MVDSSPISFGKYDLVQRLDAPGVGETFLAGELGLAGYDRQVVLKRIGPASAEQAQATHLILEHARVATTLRHPNLVAVLDVDQFEEQDFFVKETVPGIALDELIALLVQQQRPLSPRVAAAILLGAASGLDYAHSVVDAGGAPLGICHGALSPRTVVIGLDGVVKVEDLGVAYAESWLLQSAAGVDPERLRYLAPEQIRGEPPSARADQFSLGAVAWELMARRPLFAGEDANATARLVLQGPIAPLIDLVPGCPPSLDAAVQRLLARDPAQRFGRCAEVVRVLQPFFEAAGASPEAELATFLGETVGPEAIAHLQPQPLGSSAAAPATIDAPAAAPTCPACQRPQDPDARFCDACGARLSAPAPEPAAAALQSTAPAQQPVASPAPAAATGSDASKHGFGERGGEQVDVTLGGAAVYMVDGQRYVEFDDESGELESIDLSVDRVGPGSQYTETAFRGRDHELKTIRSSLERASQGTTQVVLISGADGMGKTRLLTEVSEMAGIMGFTTVTAHGARYGVPVALDTFRQWLVGTCDLLAQKRQRADLLQLCSMAEALEWLGALNLPPPLTHRLTQLFDGEHHEEIGNAVEHRQRLTAALLYFLSTAARANPLCLMVDDLQRGDAASLELLRELRGRLPQARLAIVAARTPAEAPGDLPADALRVDLRGLQSADAVQVAEDFLFHGVLPAALSQVLEDGAHGNPLLITHQMRLLLESQVLRYEGGEWMVPDVDSSYIVTSPRDFTRERSERLPPASLHAARVAAVAGEVFSRALIEAACVGQGVNVHGAIDDTMGCGLVVSLGQSREVQCFRQACSRDHMLQDMSAEVSLQIHHTLASTYERERLCSPGVAPELVARHLLAVEVPEQAEATAWRLAAAADKLLWQGMPKLAADVLFAAMRLELAHTKAAGRIPEESSARLFRQCETATRCLLQVNPMRASGLIVTLLDRLPKDHAPRERARALRYRALALLAIKRAQDAAAALDMGLRALGGADPGLTATLRAEQSLVLEASGAAKDASVLLADALQVLGRSPPQSQEEGAEHTELLASLHCRLARLYSLLRSPELALQYLKRAQEIARRGDLPLLEIRAISMLAALARNSGRPDQAVTLLGRAQAIAEEIHDPWSMARVYLEHGCALTTASRDQATDLLQRAYLWGQLSGQPEVCRAAQEALSGLS